MFDRADKVLTVCEMKYSNEPAGLEVIDAMEKRIQFLKPVSAGKTIQPVLIVHPRASRDVLNKGYFCKVIEARQLLTVTP